MSSMAAACLRTHLWRGTLFPISRLLPQPSFNALELLAIAETEYSVVWVPDLCLQLDFDQSKFLCIPHVSWLLIWIS